MLAVQSDKAFHIKTKKLEMPISPNGSGDATTALFVCHYLENKGDMKTTLEKTTSGIYEIFDTTKKSGTRELQIVASGDKLVKPEHIFTAEQI